MRTASRYMRLTEAVLPGAEGDVVLESISENHCGEFNELPLNEQSRSWAAFGNNPMEPDGLSRSAKGKRGVRFVSRVSMGETTKDARSPHLRPKYMRRRPLSSRKGRRKQGRVWQRRAWEAMPLFRPTLYRKKRQAQRHCWIIRDGDRNDLRVKSPLCHLRGNVESSSPFRSSQRIN